MDGSLVENGAIGDEAEIGLRMLAALEEMPSLEPDCEEVLVSEASIMIVETADEALAGDVSGQKGRNPPASLSGRLKDMEEAAQADGTERDVAPSRPEEVEVEIIVPGSEKAD